MDLDVYSGKLEYRDIIFDYVFDGGTLRLIPPTELKSQLYYDWFMKKIGDGAYTMAEPPMMEEPYLIGKNNEDGRRMIFITATNSAIGSYNSVFIVKIVAVIKCRLERSGIDRISFSGPEISRIHPVEKAFSFLWKEPELENGVFTVKTNPFIETSTHKQRFTVDGVCVFVSFDISRSMNNKEKHTPLSLESSMMFEFQETDDYAFIYRLYRLAKEFIQYLCYRKDIVFTGIKISAPYDGGKHEHFANMLVIDESDQVDSVSIEKNRIIRRDRLAGVEGSILNDIAKGDIYLRHIPESYSSGRNIDAARFVMITAAFEWEYRRLFPGGEEKSEKTYLSHLIEGFRPSVIKENKELYLLLLIYFVYALANQVFFPYLMVYVERTCHIANTGSSGFLTPFALLMAIALLGGSLLSVLLGFLSDKWGRERMILPSLILFGIGILLMFFIPQIGEDTPRLVYGIIAGVIFILGYVFVPTVLNAMVRDHIPEGEEGSYMGVRMLFVVALPMCIGPFIGNALNNTTGEKYANEFGDVSSIPSAYGYLVGLGILLLALLPLFFYFKEVKKHVNQ